LADAGFFTSIPNAGTIFLFSMRKNQAIPVQKSFLETLFSLKMDLKKEFPTGSINNSTFYITFRRLK